MNFKQKKVIIPLAIVLLFAIVAVPRMGAEKKGNTDQQTNEEKAPIEVSLLELASKKDAFTGIESSGKIESISEVELKSEAFGKVAWVNKELGDKVYSGETIVSLSAADLAAQRAQLSSDYQSALSAKDELKIALDSAESQYNQVLISTANRVAASKSAVDAAELRLKQSQSEGQSRIIKDAYENLYILLQKTTNILESARLESDNILGVDNSFVNDTFEKDLGVLDYSSINRAETSYAKVKRANTEFENIVRSLTLSSSEEELDRALELAFSSLEEMKNHLFDVSDVLENTQGVGSITETQLEGFKNTIIAQRTAIITQHSAFVTQKQALSASGDALSAEQIAYDKALQDYKDTQIQVEAEKESAKLAVDQAKHRYDAQDNTIARAAASVRSVDASLAKTVVRSPISGTVSFIAPKAGELVTSGSLVARVVNQDSLQIKIYLTSEEAKEISKNAKVKVGENAFGMVSNISPELNPETKKQEVVVLIDSEFNSEFVIGEFVNVVVEKTAVEGEEENKSLFLPIDAFKISPEGNFVYVVGEGDIVERREVELARIKDTNIEVVSGLEEVDAIISDISQIEVGDQVTLISNQ